MLALECPWFLPTDPDIVRLAPMKKLYICGTGGYVDLQKMLIEDMSERKVECGACLTALNQYEFSGPSLKNAIDAAIAQSKSSVDQPAKEDEAETPAADASAAANVGPAATDAEAPDAWRKYVESFAPHIELLEPGKFGKTLPYRCRLCRTRRQVDGKVGDLVEPKVSAAKYYLGQHFRTQKHIEQLAAFEKEGQPQNQKEIVPCQGLQVKNSISGGLLYYMRTEFSTWAAFTNLESLATHSYWQEPNGAGWIIRSSGCDQNMEKTKEDWQTCPECIHLGSGKRSVVRNVTRFTQKYLWAKLLNARLFQGAEARELVEEEVRKSAAFRSDPKEAEKVLKLPNHHLQQLVRATWTHTNATQVTPQCLDFLTTVVKPTLRCNVSSFEGCFQDVAARFEAMIASRDVNDAELSKLKLAAAALDGSIESNPLLEGMALACLRLMDKQKRGVETMAGRPSKDRTEREFALVADAGMRLAMATGNGKLGKQSLVSA